MRILAVDDDPTTLLIVSAVVQASGHECLTAHDGAEAWELLRSGGADVVISDWQMPGMDGLELCRRIRAQDGYTYVVLVSGRSDPTEVLRGMHAGADDYLTKPLDPSVLRLRLVAAERVTALHGRLAEQQTQLERLNAELAAASRTDALTGLRNRRALAEDLPGLLARCERHGHALSAVMVDVDHFKAYNDRFGHVAGDEALRRVGAALLITARQTDLVYRYGGEEFLCLLPADAPAAASAAERLRRAVEGMGLSNPAGTNAVLTCSAGVATWDPVTTGTRDALLLEADQALYLAKADGRNTVRSMLPYGLAAAQGAEAAVGRQTSTSTSTSA